MALSRARLAKLAQDSLLDSLRSEWDSAVADFQNAIAGLDQAESNLYAVQYQASLDPDDWEEWQSLFSKVNAAKSTIDSIRSLLAGASSAWRDFTGYFGLSGMRRQGIARSLGGVGVLPIVGGLTVGGLVAATAGIVAVTAAVASFITYLNTKNERFDQMTTYIQSRTAELEANGQDPVAASAQATREAQASAREAAVAETGYSFTGNIAKIVTWGAIGLLAVFVLPRLIDRHG